MHRLPNHLLGRCAAALLLTAAGCADDPSTSNERGIGAVHGVFDPAKLRGAELSALRRASDCTDLLTQIEDDAIAKLALTVERFRESGYGARSVGTGTVGIGTVTPGGFFDAGVAFSPSPTAPPAAVDIPTSGAVAAGTDSASSAGGKGSGEFSGGQNAGNPGTASSGDTTTASDTNTQVQGVDEADFVKVVDNGKAMFLLHGNTLRRLTTYPPEALAESGTPFVIEGQPSEMFVTEADVAVVFSTVALAAEGGPLPSDACTPYYCTSKGGYATSWTKITVVDVASATPKALRELYYQGSYTSSRRYDSVVRVVLGAAAPYGDLFTPHVDLTDPFGNTYDDDTLETQLVEWQARTEAAIRKTKLENWLPIVKEKKNGQLTDVLPDCDTYFTPEAGVTSYGLTHVLSLDTSAPGTAVGGVTILGSTSTVYSSAAQLVLAQPDYRYDFGFMPDQRTLLHVFDLDGASTGYKASGSVTGLLPQNNPQFAIDATDDGVVRVGTTGARRANPTASFSSPDFWTTTTDNRVRALAVKGDKLVVAGESASLGHAGESLQSMRFVGDRAYAVTFRNTDPLIVLDVADAAAIRVLGEIEIPGFSQYMHPLDPDHLITFGQDGSGGSQLQLFDVSHPERAIPAPKVLGFGIGSSSAVAYDHKAFTYFAEQQLIALPVYGYYWDATYNRQAFASGLQVIHVDANAGFALRGTVDHAHLYAQQGCGVCDAYGCYDYACYYASPEVRRGHFVSSDAGTFVYGFSYAGVTATDLSTFEDVAKLTLPTPDFGGYYGGGYYGGGGIAVPPVYVSPPVAVDGPPPTRVDAGVAVVDGGVVTTTDGGVANGG